MAGRRSTLTTNAVDSLPGSGGGGDPLRELFEACKTGDLAKVKALVNPKTVNARDTAGRKSTPLHFAAGESDTSMGSSVLFSNREYCFQIIVRGCKSFRKHVD